MDIDKKIEAKLAAKLARTPADEGADAARSESKLRQADSLLSQASNSVGNAVRLIDAGGMSSHYIVVAQKIQRDIDGLIEDVGEELRSL